MIDVVREARKELDIVQTSLKDDPLSRELIQEKKAMREVMRATRAEESIHRPKSREQVITLGDNNTEFFFKLVQAIRIANRISCIKDANGEVLEDAKLIGQACVEYYKNIYDPMEMP